MREWTADGYDAGFYAKKAATQPDAKAQAGKLMTVRGGSFLTKAASARIAMRTGVDPATFAVDLGLRCAKTVK